jgi:hypothetical protein
VDIIDGLIVGLLLWLCSSSCGVFRYLCVCWWFPFFHSVADYICIVQGLIGCRINDEEYSLLFMYLDCVGFQVSMRNGS